MSAFRTDGTFTSKWPIGKARISYPIPQDTTAYLLEQDYMQLKSSYSAASLNSTHYTELGGASPTDGGSTGDNSAYLVEIGQHQDLGAGLIQWTEVYASKPASRDEYESYSYNFIGFYGLYGGANVTTVTGRDRFTQTVTSRVAYAYYRIFASGGDYTAVSSIPQIVAQAYVFGSTTNNLDFLADSPPFTTASTPSRTDYEAVMAGGSGLGTGAAAGEIVAEQSILRRYRGNIWERATRYIKAL